MIWLGHGIYHMDHRSWTLERNDSWLYELIQNEVVFFVPDSYAREGSVFQRELRILYARGYRKEGNFFYPK